MTLVNFGIICVVVAFVSPLFLDLPTNVPVVMALIGAGLIIIGMVMSLENPGKDNRDGHG